jgi:hypothetical protein
MLTKTLLIIPFFVIDWSTFSGANLSLAAGKMRKNYLVKGSFWYGLTEPQAASCKHFQCQNRRFRVFTVGYWNDSQN